MLPASAWATSSPVVAGHISDAVNLSGTTSVAVSGHYAYTTAYHAGELTAVDISNPASPSIAGESAPFLDTNLIGGSNVAIAGGYAFVVSKNRNASTTNNDDGNGNSLTILDVHSNPASPAVVGTVQSPTQLFGAYGIAVSGTHAYVAYQGILGSGQPSTPDTSTGGISVIDISSLGSPTIVKNIDNGALPAPWTGQNLFDHSTAVQISGHYAYVTAFNSARLTAIDISNPTSPQIVGSVQDATNMAFPADLAVQGNYAYVADQTGGTSAQLTVVDISNPASPRVADALSAASVLGGAYRIRVRGPFAYVSGSSANTISAVDISTPAAPRLAGSVFDGTLLHRTTGLDLDSTGAYAVASSPYSPSEANATFPPYPDSGVSGSPTNTGTISVINLDPQPIAATISAASEPPNPTTQTSANFNFSVSDTVSAVQCSLDGAAFVACTSPTTQTYSGLGAGCHTFAVAATGSDGQTASDRYSWTVNAGAPVACAPPSLSGTAALGSSLTATPGTWAGTAPVALAYQWQRCNASGTGCASIPGAVAQTYTPQRADVASTLKVVVTASNGSGSSSATAGPAGPVSGPPSVTSAPSISGIALPGQTLTASPGRWSGSPSPTFSYQWQRCSAAGTACAPIAGAGTSSYAVQRADVGATIVVAVTARNPSGTATTYSAGTRVIAGAPVPTKAPTITGTVMQGDTLKATAGVWTGYPSPALVLSWERCTARGTACNAISHAATYVVTSADVGSRLLVSVRASSPAGIAVSRSALTRTAFSNARASITGVRKRAAKLALSVTAPGHGVLIKEVDIKLPSVMRFVTSTSALVRAITVRDGHNRLLHASLSLRSGQLIIRSRAPLPGLHVTITALGLRIRQAFTRGVTAHHKPIVVLALKVLESHRVTTYDQLSLHVS